MKYNITINQPKMIEHNLSITYWCILDVISVAPTWSEAINKDGEIYFWVARQKIAEELKGLDLKPDTIYRNLKKLVALGFLDYVKLGKKDLIRLSKKGKSIFVSTMSDMNPNHYVGNESENNSDMNPTYNYTNLNNYTSINIDFSNHLNVNQDTANEWFEYKKYKSKAPVTKCLNFLNKYTKQEQKEIIDNSIMNEYAGLFPPKKQNNFQQETKAQRNKRLIDEHFAEMNKDTECDFDGEIL